MLFVHPDQIIIGVYRGIVRLVFKKLVNLAPHIIDDAIHNSDVLWVEAQVLVHSIGAKFDLCIRNFTLLLLIARITLPFKFRR